MCSVSANNIPESKDPYPGVLCQELGKELSTPLRVMELKLAKMGMGGCPHAAEARTRARSPSSCTWRWARLSIAEATSTDGGPFKPAFGLSLAVLRARCEGRVLDCQR